ncbi:MAG: response regulator transcription factor [Pseudomonadota bacterium]
MRIILVERHAMTREATALLLQTLAVDVTVIGATTASEAFSLLTHYKEVDLLILDLGICDLDGDVAIENFQQISPDTPILILADHDSSVLVTELIKRGVAGYISKSDSSHDLSCAVKVVLSGEIYLPPRYINCSSATEKISVTKPKNSPIESKLTPRQHEVLQLVVEGKSNKGIARDLNISEATVKLHVSAVLRILDAQNRTEAVNIAMRIGLIRQGMLQ